MAVRSLSRITTLVLVAVAVAAGVALADTSGGGNPSTKVASYGRADTARSDVVAATAATVATAATEVASTPPGSAQGALVGAVADSQSGPASASADNRAVDTSACGHILTSLASVQASVAAVEQDLTEALPEAQAASLVATLEASLASVEATLTAAHATCLAAATTATTGPPTSGPPHSVGGIDCTDLPAQRAAVKAEIDAAEAQLRTLLSGTDLATAIASLEAARTQANKAFTTADASCASGPSSSTTVPTATCAQIRADRTAFNAEIDAAKAQLQSSVPAEQRPAAIAAVEAGRVRGNAKFDAALATCTG